MAGNNDTIKYSDLVQPDNSVVDLIQQLENLQGTYRLVMKDIRTEAAALRNELKGASGAKGDDRDRIKKNSKATDELAKAHERLAESEKESAEQLALLRKATAENNAMSKLAAKLADSEEGSYNRLSAQYSINKIALNNMSAEYRRTTKEGQQLEKETRDLYEEMKRLQSVTGMNQLNVGNYKDATKDLGQYHDEIKNVLGLNTQFGNSLFDLAQKGEGVNGMFSMIANGAKSFGAALLTLLANPVFLIIAGIAGAGAAFKFWFDYNQGLVEATRLTQQFTGKSGDDLKAYRNEIQAVADMYDKDFKEVLISANAVAKQFGIDQVDALKAVRDGFVAGADANGEFLENLKEYPAYFKEAGISASQFVAIVAQTNKSGIYSDKGIDAIKEANLRIREMTKATYDALGGIGINANQVQKDLQSGAKTTFQVMQEVSKKLNELPANSAVVGTAIADIFGGPGEDAGLQYLKTLKDIDTNLDNVKANAGELGKLQEDQLKSQIELENTIGALFDQTGGTFESMVTKGKIWINEVLVKMIKGLVDFINYWIDLYNQSELFRAIIQTIVADWNILTTTVKASFTFMIDQIKTIGKALHGAFTLNLDEIEEAYTDWGDNMLKFTKTVVNGTVKAVQQGAANMQKKLKPIELNILTTTSGGGSTAATPSGGTRKAPVRTFATGGGKKDDAAKKLEEVRKHNLDIVRKYEDLQTELETNEFDKRRQKALLSYQRQTDDLRFQLATDLKLTKEGREAINATIAGLAVQNSRELEKIEQDRQTSSLAVEKAAIELRLSAMQKGSEREIELRRELIDTEEEIALAENAKKPLDQRQGENIIKSQYAARRAALVDEEKQLLMMQFDFQQEREQSEFDLLYNSENRKTKFRLEQEKKRLQKILELNKTANTKLSEDQVKAIENTIAKIDQEIKATGAGQQDIYEVFGLNLGDEQKEAINESVNFAISQLSSILDQKVRMAEQAVAASEKEVEASQSALDAEIEARNNGYANNVVQAQKDLDLARKQQEQAEKDKEKAVKRQQQLDTITQTSSLITASANIWSSLSIIPIVGTALAVAALALMWGSFIASKSKAKSAAKADTYGDGTVELLGGGSHASGNDVDLGTRPDGRKRRAEGGEIFAVFNKRNSRKYRREIMRTVKAFNNGTIEDLFNNSYKTDGLSLSVGGGSSTDLKQLESDVSAIRKQNEERYFVDGNGNIVMKYKNLTRTKRK